MANWGITDLLNQKIDDLYEIIKARDIDAATMFAASPTTPPIQSIRFNRQTKIYEEWDGVIAWTPLLLAIAGGGTGAGDAAGARANLGIGTMGIQSSNAIAVTGGTLTGITSLVMAGHLTFIAGGQYNIGASSSRAGRVYISGGLVVPVGANKYVPTP